MEFVIIGGLLLVVWALAKEKPQPVPAIVAPAVAQPVSSTVPVAQSVILPSRSPASQQDAPLPVAVLQQPTESLHPIPGPIYITNPDIGNYGQFGPPLPMVENELTLQPPIVSGLAPGPVFTPVSQPMVPRDTAPLPVETTVIPFATQFVGDL